MSDAWDAAGSMVDGVFGKDADKAFDKSNFKATNWASNPDYNPNAFNYGGGDAGHAEFLANQQGDVSGQYRDRGDAAQRRVLAEDQGLVGADQASRGDVNSAVGMQRSIAEGRGPSQAGAIMNQGLNQASAQQAAQAGGARGGAAMALAQGNAQANSAMMNQNAVNDAARIKSQEQLSGAGMYGSLAAQQRGMDQNRIGQNNQMTVANRQSNDAYDIQNQNLAMQRAQLAHQMRSQQQQGAMGQQQLLANSDAQTQGMNKEVNLYNTNAVKGRMAGVGGMLGGLGGSLMGMGGGAGGMGAGAAGSAMGSSASGSSAAGSSLTGGGSALGGSL